MTTKVNQRMIDSTNVYVGDFGAVGDGVTDDTLALSAAADNAVSRGVGITFDPKGIYLISNQNLNNNGFSNIVMKIDSVRAMKIDGRGCTIKGVNVDVSIDGLFLMEITKSYNIEVCGFNFDMTFTGQNISNANKYPEAGGILINDDPAIGQSYADINHDLNFHSMTFKLFHPAGSYATSTAPYLGDGNNGFKIYSITAFGNTNETDPALQAKNIKTQNITFLEGHNAYGIWIWAWANWECSGCIAECWVSKHSDENGVMSGAGIPMLRTHQFYTSGVHVHNNTFKARASAQRLSATFDGDGSFLHMVTNIVGDFSHGDYVVTNNTITMGNGDAAHEGLFNIAENAVLFIGYGKCLIADNTFDVQH